MDAMHIVMRSLFLLFLFESAQFSRSSDPLQFWLGNQHEVYRANQIALQNDIPDNKRNTCTNTAPGAVAISSAEWPCSTAPVLHEHRVDLLGQQLCRFHWQTASAISGKPTACSGDVVYYSAIVLPGVYRSFDVIQLVGTGGELVTLLSRHRPGRAADDPKSATCQPSIQRTIARIHQ